MTRRAHRPDGYVERIEDADPFGPLLRYSPEARAFVSQQLARGRVRIEQINGRWRAFDAEGHEHDVPRWIGERAHELGVDGLDLRR